ncbi:bifunctional 5,10-methylene-tetrahydrofolate dehydrogenase/5,10-methylene-tetrahydrofolate cyclohydrolase [Desulfobulbus sp. US1]|uniref:Bifunctional protein FolD n=1 Tax=Candidatus Electrothrix communis TaxID=1859133 RepID=A0A444J6P6_9BACT|nr:bifunctional 5,10-methylene-tetrahydrofolate dehydrogenase/5,10-methylene-tetrahydrofolate cyclohydrolase [Desulfobulbus sp. US4]MCW5207500.1 bifunctional 5,10-methylene-tetrahydrofolate dehydrogenase/5,10-methylene-tetrahydrofolate cyclohydrolase [Desulfobulbus sp. US2]MCW5208908.1 bifunctional 5,10-methylene-tetrahydrofolate dehydrogenase/5,10-methylene-tetrahydrofolate cyclohydrolase [Desulfobulbus sp. US1]MCW5210190.1 bifunctional 5,10-methylene-tetrahydrofolate dehydrogenase/5,10-methyle
MSAKIISGTETAKAIREELKKEVAELAGKVVPGLVTILVGEDPASQSYVAAKNKTAHALGIHSEQVTLDAETSEEDLLALVEKYNNDDKIHGILVQLPLPKHIDEGKVLYAINPDKDVDGFHPVNVGKMVVGEQCFLPCTPHGVLELLTRSGVETSGAEVVVVGRSNIVGKPVANLMMQKRAAGNATVTLCHTRTKDMDFHTKRADILIVAAGVANMIKADQVKEGVVIIDVGVNRVGMTESGKAKLAGDVDFESVKEKAAAITPVPGGVGPMTITMLMKNTVQAARQFAGLA